MSDPAMPAVLFEHAAHHRPSWAPVVEVRDGVATYVRQTSPIRTTGEGLHGTLVPSRLLTVEVTQDDVLVHGNRVQRDAVQVVIVGSDGRFDRLTVAEATRLLDELTEVLEDVAASGRDALAEVVAGLESGPLRGRRPARVLDGLREARTLDGVA